METFSHREPLCGVQGSQEFEVYIHAEGVESQAEKKDYDTRLHYHPGKAKVVAYALSRKSHVNTLMTRELPKELAEDLRELCLELVPRGYVAALEI